jgi:hypothetical protein
MGCNKLKSLEMGPQIEAHKKTCCNEYHGQKDDNDLSFKVMEAILKKGS